MLKANSSRADDVMDLVLKHGDDALDVVRKYGDEGIDLLRKHGEDALDAVKKYGDDAVDIYRRYGDNGVKYANKYGDDAVNAIRKYGDTAYNAIDKYGDDAVKDLKSGATPKEIQNVQKYLKGIVDGAGNIDAAQMDKVRLAIQNGKFSSREIKLLSKKMSELGITEAYESVMKNINFGEYLRKIKGKPPENMIDPHAHHILFKTGNGAAQQELVKEGQEILRKYGIDPIVGEENLVWAPNRVVGQHDKAALEEVVNALKAVDKAGGDYDDIVEVLKRQGIISSQR